MHQLVLHIKSLLLQLLILANSIRPDATLSDKGAAVCLLVISASLCAHRAPPHRLLHQRRELLNCRPGAHVLILSICRSQLSAFLSLCPLLTVCWAADSPACD